MLRAKAKPRQPPADRRGGGAAGEGVLHEVVIEPGRGDRLIDWRELVDYRDLCLFLIWRGSRPATRRA